MFFLFFEFLFGEINDSHYKFETAKILFFLKIFFDFCFKISLCQKDFLSLRVESLL